MKRARIIVSILGFFSLVAAFLLYNMGYQQVAIVLLFVCGGVALFLIVDRLGHVGSRISAYGKTATTRNRLIDLGIVGLILTSTIVLIVYELPLFKPPLFYILVSLAQGLIFLRIACNNEDALSTKDIWVTIIEIVALMLFLKWSFFLGVYQFEDDPGDHLFYVGQIVQTGFIPNVAGMEVYNGVPAFHILMASISLVSDVSLGATVLVAAFLQSLTIILVYLLALKFTNSTRVSLFSALVFSALGLNLKYSLVYTTQGLSLVIILLALYLVVSLIRMPQLRSKYTLLCLPVFGVMIFWHYFYSFVGILLALIPIVLIKSMDRLRSFSRETVGQAMDSIGRYTSLVLLLIVSWVAYLMYSNVTMFAGSVESVWAIFSLKPLLASLELETGLVAALPGFLPDFVLTYLGTFLLLALAIAGGLFLLRDGGRYKRTLALIVVVYTIIVLPTALADVAFLRPRIHFYFLGAIVAMLAGYAINECVHKTQLINRSRALLIFPAAFLIIFSFFSITTRLANDLDPILFMGDVPCPWYHSYHERAVLQDISEYIPQDATIVTDFRTASRGSIPRDMVKPAVFSDNSLPELDSGYDYVIINTDSIDKGMTFWSFGQGGQFGLNIDHELLNARLSRMDLLLNSGVIELYR